MRSNLFICLLVFLSLFTQLSCKKKKDGEPQTVNVPIIPVPTNVTKPDTGYRNSYYAEKMDAYFYFERRTTMIEDHNSVISIYHRDGLYSNSIVNSLQVDNLEVKFGGMNLPFDTNYKSYGINLPFGGTFEGTFSFPNSWQITEKDSISSLHYTITSIPDTFTFASPPVDSSLAGEPYEVKLDRPITGADSVLVEIGSITKVFPGGQSSFIFTAQETAKLKSDNWEYIGIYVLPYKRTRRIHNGKKYVFETARLVKKSVFIK